MGLFNRKKKQAETVEKTVDQEAPVVERGIPREVVAAITAAVVCMLGAGAKVVGIRKVKRDGTGKKAWRNAAAGENTRPF